MRLDEDFLAQLNTGRSRFIDIGRSQAADRTNEMICISKLIARVAADAQLGLERYDEVMRNRPIRTKLALTACLLSWAACDPALAAGDTPRPAIIAEQPFDPGIVGAVATLRQMHDYLRNATDLEFRTTFNRYGATDARGKSGSAKFEIRKPNQFRVNASVKGQVTIYVSDGKTLSIFRPKSGKYMQIPAAETIIGTMYDATGILAQQARIVDFFWTVDYLEQFRADVRISNEGSVEEVAGRQCARFAVERMDDHWDVWIAKGEPPLPCRLVSRRRDTSAQVQSNDFEWTIDPKFATDTFVFKPPAGARKVDNYELD